MKIRSLSRGFAFLTLLLAVTCNTSYGLRFNFDFSGMTADQEAACERAADQWKAVITDNVRVNVSISMASLADGTLGSTGTYQGAMDWTSIVNSMKSDASTTLDNNILPSLPSPSQYSYTAIDNGRVDTSDLLISTANYKAIGGIYNGDDAVIQFSTNYGWDYDNSDGITTGMFDFESVVAHELGHALGFISVLDSTNMKEILDLQEAGNTIDEIWFNITPMDLFRFESANLPANVTEFTGASHDVTPGGDDFFFTGMNNIALSDGLTRQASHLEDNLGLGIMDPTLGPGETSVITANDLAVMDLIGWDVDWTAVPEPATLGLVLVGFVALNLKRTRKFV